MTDKFAFGFLIRREAGVYGGGPKLVAEIVRRDGDHRAPRNVSSGLFGYSHPDETPLPGYRLGGLAMRGWASDINGATFIGFEPAFYDTHAIHLPDARAMTKTLDRIVARVRKDAAHDAVDMFASVCAALKLSFVVECKSEGRTSSYDASEWRWMSIGDGRNLYRREIEKLCQEERERKAA